MRFWEEDYKSEGLYPPIISTLHTIDMTFRDLPGGPVVKTLPSSAEGAGSVLVGELRSYMPHGQKTKTQNRTNIGYKFKSGSHTVVSDSLWPHGLKPTRLLCPWDSPGKNIGVGCPSLLTNSINTIKMVHMKKKIMTCLWCWSSLSGSFLHCKIMTFTPFHTVLFGRESPYLALT